MTVKSMNLTIEEKKMAIGLPNCLRETNDSLNIALDPVRDESETLKYDHVKSRIMQEEQPTEARFSQATIKSGTTALLSNSQPKTMTSPKCSCCRKHWNVESRYWKKHLHLNPHRKKRKENAFVAAAEAEDTEVICLLAQHSKASTQQDWFIDSGCSNHVIDDKSLFSTHSTIQETHSAHLGDSNKALILSQGNFEIHVNTNFGMTQWKLENTLHVPAVGYNLTSVPSFDKFGFPTTFKSNCRFISPERRIIATGTMSRKFYKLDICSR